MPPPLTVPAGQSRISSSSSPSNGSSYGFGQLTKVFLLVLVFATGIRLAIIKFMTRKRRRVIPYQVPSLQEKDVQSCRKLSEEGPKQHEIPRCKDQQLPTSRPVYPWNSPPQTLPGPYDPRFYPLPTIRRHSYDPSVITPEETSSVFYTRRVSTNSIPAQPRMLHGTVTTSKKGWRRNQWVISGE